MNRPGALVFDLDGTLIDSRRDITTAINLLRADLGLAPLLLEQVVEMVGEGATVLVRRALADWREDLAPERLRDVLERYLSYYWKVCLETTRPYPGIEAMLEELGRSYRLALLSNKGAELSAHILAALGLSRHFREILGGDSLPTRKPDPAGLAVIAGRFGIPPERLMLVGDSRVDAGTARNAGCAFALVEWGFVRAARTDGLDADLIASSPEELVQKLMV
jgi:phosphoglycolate phosphatase